MSKLDASELVAALAVAGAFVTQPETWPVFRSWLMTQKYAGEVGDITRGEFRSYISDATRLADMLADAEKMVSALTGGTS